MAEQVGGFLAPFSPEYIRVHRGDGMKSVLCFPTCKPGGHKIRTFCGDNVYLRIPKMPKGSVVCAQMRVCRPYSLQFKQNEKVPKGVLMRRFGEHPCDPSWLIRGKISPIEDTELAMAEFDPTCHVPTGENGGREKIRIWHYEWKPPKRSKMQEEENLHCFTVYCFQQLDGVDGDLLKVTSIIDSSTFKVGGRERKKRSRRVSRKALETKTKRKVSLPQQSQAHLHSQLQSQIHVHKQLQAQQMHMQTQTQQIQAQLQLIQLQQMAAQQKQAHLQRLQMHTNSQQNKFQQRAEKTLTALAHLSERASHEHEHAHMQPPTLLGIGHINKLSIKQESKHPNNIGLIFGTPLNDSVDPHSYAHLGRRHIHAHTHANSAVALQNQLRQAADRAEQSLAGQQTQTAGGAVSAAGLDSLNFLAFAAEQARHQGWGQGQGQRTQIKPQASLQIKREVEVEAEAPDLDALEE